MKPLTFAAMTLCLFLSLNSYALTETESLKKLQQFSSKDVATSSGKSEKEVGLKVQEMLSVMDDVVDSALKEKKGPSENLVKELVRVSALLNQADPSQAVSEIILPLYQKQKKAFEKALKSLPPKERADLEESLKDSAREEEEGNG